MTWRLHIQMIEAKAFRTFIRIYSLFKSERLSANIKLTLHKALIRSVITYAAECHLLKLQRLQNKVLRTIGIFPRCKSVRDMHKAFQIPYVYDYITKSCRQQAEVIQNHFFLNPFLFASCTCTFSKWWNTKKGVKRSAQ
jgi:hypothetical protein